MAIGVACDGWTAPNEDAPAGHTCPLSVQQKDGLLTLTVKLLNDHNLTPEIIGKRSDYRPVPDLLGDTISAMQDALLGDRPRPL